MSTLCKVDADAVYIHIPFCLQKCEYCDFTSFSGKSEWKKRYLEALRTEILLYEHSYYDTIYFGGGTPSLLEGEEISEILKLLPYDERSEITLECNPKTLNSKKLREYYQAGVNRLSIGIQSMKEKYLNLLGRLHTAEEAKEVFWKARELGFQNISVDMMFSLPTQTLKEVKEDVEEFLSLGAEHISIYSLIWEENTPFFTKLEKGIYHKTENDLEAEMYQSIIERMKQKGYEHYEISNFAKKGYISRHNQKYWKNQKYLGLGLGASGYLGKLRYTNCSDFETYFFQLENYRFPREEEEVLTQEMIEEYRYILAFRQLREWVSARGKYIEICNILWKKGYVRKRKQEYKITEKGLFFFNDMLEYFL